MLGWLNASLKSTETMDGFQLPCTCNPNKSYVKMPVSARFYIPTLPQEQAARTKMLSVVRIQQKEYMYLYAQLRRVWLILAYD